MEPLEAIAHLEQKLQELEKKHEQLKQGFYTALGSLLVLFIIFGWR
jgi:hypothetical protein